MNGKYLLDTNAIIYAIDQRLKLPSNIYAISIITEMELFSWPSLSAEDENKLRSVLQRLYVVQLDKAIQDAAIKIRRTTSMKLPDAIISATAVVGGFTLVTYDARLRNRHIGQVISLEELLS